MATLTDATVLAAAEWRELEERHRDRADRLSSGWRERAGTGRTHPVEDFLFTYYPVPPRVLRRWHPGARVVLADAAGSERADWRWYATRGDDVTLDTAAFVEARGSSIRFIVSLLGATARREPRLGCFGLHEWAMVYRQGEHRHEAPLRLSQSETDAVVEGARISCTHFDAYRFFTPPAAPLNRLIPTRENQPAMEQPGCLHAGMDIYKWATKLGPLLPGALLLDAFELAANIRELDMRASPYDLSEWGYAPVAIETAEGKAEYVRRQRDFAARGNALREGIVGVLDGLL
ncbi:MAG TPA: 3-methyladenine DNA glycosylase [Lacisediminihabitans sp.]|nr:3-methyladenine DNA glycosylase [Lacisediminihabitans sp.]HXD60682.1 3-methyladenine DNA glycosylase [Lacisediminihabitans sp.]